MYVLVLLSTSVGTEYLVALKFQAHKDPPLATSPHPVGPSARSTNSSAGQKPCTALVMLSM